MLFEVRGSGGNKYLHRDSKLQETTVKLRL